jgi:hypothetical protein
MNDYLEAVARILVKMSLRDIILMNICTQSVYTPKVTVTMANLKFPYCSVTDDYYRLPTVDITVNPDSSPCR